MQTVGGAEMILNDTVDPKEGKTWHCQLCVIVVAELKIRLPQKFNELLICN